MFDRKYMFVDKSAFGSSQNGKNMSKNDGLGSRSRVFLALWSRNRLKKTRSWSRLEKKSGAEAAINLAGSSALRED